MGLSFLTRHGNIFLGVVDEAVYTYAVPFITMTELLVVGYAYGINKFMEDVGLMLGNPAGNKRFQRLGSYIWKSPAKW